MAASPIDELLAAIDALDLERAVGLLAPQASLLLVDGRRGEGKEAARSALREFFAALHGCRHRTAAQWHLDDVWVAEVEVDYELRDRSRHDRLPRAFIVRSGSEGIEELRVYGAHEQALDAPERGDGSMRIGGRFMPPL